MNENELKKPWLSSAEDDDVFSDILESRHLVVFPWLIEIILGLRPASVLDYNGGRWKVPRRASPAIRRRAVALRPLSSLGSESKALGNADVRFC
jgi:hypothetical protein